MSEDMDNLVEIAEQRDFHGSRDGPRGSKRGVIASHALIGARGTIRTITRAAHASAARSPKKVTLPTVVLPDLDAEEAAPCQQI